MNSWLRILYASLTHPHETVFPPLAPTLPLPQPNPVEASPPAIPHPPEASSGPMETRPTQPWKLLWTEKCVGMATFFYPTYKLELHSGASFQ